MEHKIKLQSGFKDRSGVIHQEVVFGKRLTGGDLMSIDNDRQAQSPTQYSDLVRRKAMTKFGELKTMPPPLEVLLGLSRIDRSILAEGYEEFARLGRGERTSEILAGSVLKLFFGFQVDGVTYPVVRLDRPTTGYDELECDARALDGLSRLCFLIGRSISRIETEDGKLSIEGPVELELFKPLDGDDISVLREGDRLAQAFFRITGGEVPQERPSDDDASSDEGNGAERAGTPEAADVTA